MRASVVSASRRFIELKLPTNSIVSGIAESKAIDIVAGDEVECDNSGGQFVVKRVYPRKNCLSRCYRKAEKKLAANLDLLLVVCAAHPLFNTSFIDRVITAANSQDIEFVLLLNKCDLKLDKTSHLIEIYKNLGVSIMQLSALEGRGFDTLSELLNNPNLKKTALAGISGVGKTSILNRLIPGTKSRTEAVSDRTGQGRQTTSQSYAYSYPRNGMEDLFLIDLPGLSNFGLTHLDLSSVKLYFAEFLRYHSGCQYKDCLHLREPECAVKKAVERNEISLSRYESYIEIVNEIEDSKEY